MGNKMSARVLKYAATFEGQKATEDAAKDEADKKGFDFVSHGMTIVTPRNPTPLPSPRSAISALDAVPMQDGCWLALSF